MASFSIVSRRSAGVHFLTPVGRLDRITGPMLENEFDATARGTAALIVVNLSRLSMLTPAGVEVLLRINDACADDAGRLRVINGSRPVARALEITGAWDRLPIMSPRTADPTPI
jgi:anti-sigma B factor antagonist